jgi:general secretion pathway protein N
MFLFKKRFWIPLTLIITLALVVFTIPASWVVFMVQQAMPGFQVSGVSGSPWKGQAEYSQWMSRGQTLPLGELQWSLQGASLLSLSPCVNFSTKADQQSIQGHACYSILSGSAKLKDVDIQLPIARVSPFFNVDLSGGVDAFIKSAGWQNQKLVETNINLLWENASLFNGNQWVPLGDIQALAKDDGQGGLMSEWNNVNSGPALPPIELDVNVGLSRLHASVPSIAVDGFIKPGPDAVALEQMLQFIGEPRGDGSYQITINE